MRLERLNVPHKSEADRKAWRRRYDSRNRERNNARQQRYRSRRRAKCPEFYRLIDLAYYYRNRNERLPKMIAYNKRNRVRQRPLSRARMARDRADLKFHYLKQLIVRDGLEVTTETLNRYKERCQIWRQKHWLRALATGSMILNPPPPLKHSLPPSKPE